MNEKLGREDSHDLPPFILLAKNKHGALGVTGSWGHEVLGSHGLGSKFLGSKGLEVTGSIGHGAFGSKGLWVARPCCLGDIG